MPADRDDGTLTSGWRPRDRFAPARGLRVAQGIRRARSTTEGDVEHRTPQATLLWVAITIGFIALLGMAAASLYPALFDSVGSLAVVCLLGVIVSSALAIASFRANAGGVLFNSLGYMISAATIYFFFGPLFYVFASHRVLEAMPAVLRFSYASGCFVTFLNLFGVSLATLGFSAFTFSTLENAISRSVIRYRPVPLVPAWITLCAVGMATELFVILPYEFALTSTIPPAIFRVLGSLPTVGILVGWRIAGRKKPLLFLLTLTMTLVQLVVGFLLLNKTVIISTVLCAVIGRYSRTNRKFTLLAGLSTIILVYLFATPLVLLGRQEIGFDASGRPRAATLSDRVGIVTHYVSTRGTETQSLASGYWWNRLNYLPVQVVAMRLYDGGQHGDLLEKLHWVLVPRLLYPSKPQMQSDAVEFTRKVFGSISSSTGMGIFVNGYYNGGWLGVIFGALAYGLSLRIVYAMARPIAREGTVLLAPMLLPAIFMGLRADGDILNDVLGSTVLWLTLAAGTIVAAKFIRPTQA